MHVSPPIEGAMTDTIDNAADALCVELFEQYKRNPKWNDAKDVIEEIDCYALVRAVFEAIRTADRRMYHAGQAAPPRQIQSSMTDDELAEACVEPIWTAMIDEALK